MLKRCLWIMQTRRLLNESPLSHINPETNTPRMVDVSAKTQSIRKAHAQAYVNLPHNVFLEICRDGDGSTKKEIIGPKGPVFATAIIGGVMAAKKTSDLIPFCHPIGLEKCDIKVEIDGVDRIRIDCQVATTNKTGVEMEALVGASVASLCVYDMLKAMSHDIEITAVKLIKKTGGKSDFQSR